MNEETRPEIWPGFECIQRINQMREGGVEPPRRLRHRILNPARLPISPLSLLMPTQHPETTFTVLVSGDVAKSSSRIQLSTRNVRKVRVDSLLFRTIILVCPILES